MNSTRHSGNLNEKETQKRGDMCKHIAVHFAMHRKHNTVKQLYSKTIKKKKGSGLWSFFHVLIAHLCISFRECRFRLFAYQKTLGSPYFGAASFFMYISLHASPLWDTRFANTGAHFVVCLFGLLMVCFEARKFYILMKSNLFSPPFGSLLCLWCHF